MKKTDHPVHTAAGFTLPAVLVIVGALLILAVGLLLVTGIERRTARSYVDLQRAEMATRAGLEEVKGILDRETANDDFIVVAQTPALRQDANKSLDAVPYLYIARGEGEGDGLNFRYNPLFSTEKKPGTGNSDLTQMPSALDFVGDDPEEIETLPYMNPAFTAWVPIKGMRNGKEQTVARYAYWVEDLQSKVNPKIAGNERGDGNVHARNEYPFPAPGLNPEPLAEDQPALDGIAIYALDEKAVEVPKGDLVRRVMDGRDYMVSPASILGATGFTTPLKRNDRGLPEDTTAATLEKNTSPVIEAYEERPLIPFAPGILNSGQPKLNLNKLLTEDRKQAIGEFAGQIRNALPKFEDRQGGFKGGTNSFGEVVIGDHYLETIAANALDYADEDSNPSLEVNSYRGLDAYPLMSEIVLKTDYLGYTVRNNRLVLRFQFNLQVEFWNMTNIPATGMGRVSYEVGLPPEAIGAGVRGLPFDDKGLLNDKTKSQHDLVEIDGRFYSREFAVTVQPDEYKFYNVATVNYLIDAGPNNVSYQTPFSLIELLSDRPRGISFLWNGQQVERIEKIVRDAEGVKFTILYAKDAGKAAIPGHGYGPYQTFKNNMGDPRMSHYLRSQRLSENSYPRNLSPNRRNIRRATIYDGNTSNFYGRVMPSEWPDGGHDSDYGQLPIVTDTKTPLTDARYSYLQARDRAYAPQRISNAGLFYSPTELGHIYDPIMWNQEYDDIDGSSGRADSAKMLAGIMPSSRNSFPDVGERSAESLDYGGGNTLRIGRYEHKRFDLEEDGMRAAYLLDLFHAGKGTSENTDEREGDVVDINGQVNVNTASKDTLRALAAGILKQDQQLREVTSWTHETANGRMAPSSKKIELGTPTKTAVADVIADAIILRRPFSAMGQLSAIRDEKDQPVFGNRKLYPDHQNISWTDAAAEEVFARIHDASTFRSRNFRVWVVGQSLAGTEQNPEVLAETRRVFTVFADPGERSADGSIKKENMRSRVTYENDF